MSAEIREFKSFTELLKFIEEEVSSCRKMLEFLKKRYQSLQAQARSDMVFLESLKKIMGNEKLNLSTEVNVGGLSIIYPARAYDEFKVVEDTLRRVQVKLNTLERVRKIVEVIAKNIPKVPNMKIIIQLINGIPFKLLIRSS